MKTLAIIALVFSVTPALADPRVESAQLRIEVSPHGMIYVDGLLKGRKYATLDVKPGNHVVEVVYYRDRLDKRVSSATIQLAGGEHRLLEFNLSKKPIPPVKDSKVPGPAGK